MASRNAYPGRPQHSSQGGRGGGRPGANASTGKTRDYREPENLNTVPLWFYPCHIVAAIFQFMQSFVLFAFSKEVEARHPIYSNYRGDYNVLSEGFGIPLPFQAGEISLTVFSGICVLLSAFDHMLTVIPGVRPKYEHYLKRNQSPYRWLEYGISAAIMRVQVAQIAGVTDFHLLVCIFFLTSCCISFGLIHEPTNARARADGYDIDFFGLWFAFIPHMVTWAIIYCYFTVGIVRGEDPPGYVGTILVALFILDGSFAAVFIMQWKEIGYFKDYVFGEFIFIMLSFTAKTFLAWITYGSISSGRLNGAG